MFFNAQDDAGVLQVFRQAANTVSSNKICLRGVDDDTLYNLNDIDGLNSFASISGAQLKQGITVNFPNPASAAVIFIQKAGQN
jgi:hypothetical protein